MISSYQNAYISLVTSGVELLSKPVIYVPIWAFVPESSSGVLLTVLYLNDEGMQADGMEFQGAEASSPQHSVLDEMVRRGYLVISVSRIEAIAKINPNTIVVLNNCQPIALPWLNQVKAVLEMWYPGDGGGVATASVLLGHTDPAGRMPFTWAKRPISTFLTIPRIPTRSS